MIQVVKTAPDSQLLNLLEYDFLSETQKQFSDIYSFQEIILSENYPTQACLWMMLLRWHLLVVFTQTNRRRHIKKTSGCKATDMTSNIIITPQFTLITVLLVNKFKYDINKLTVNVFSTILLFEASHSLLAGPYCQRQTYCPAYNTFKRGNTADSVYYWVKFWQDRVIWPAIGWESCQSQI